MILQFRKHHVLRVPEADHPRIFSLLMGPFGSVATEGVDSPGPRDRLTAVPESLWNKIFLTGFDGDASATND